MDLSDYRALVIDDSEDMISVIQTGLKSLGMKDSFCLTNPGLVMDALITHEPDIVITDWVMEPTDGLELAKQIRAPGSPNRYIPIIILTAYAEAWRISVARDAGINEFLAKPISINGLKERVAQTLLRPRPFIECETYFGPCRRRKARPFEGDERRALQLTPELSETAADAPSSAPPAEDEAYAFPEISHSPDFDNAALPEEVRVRLQVLQDSYPTVLASQVAALADYKPALVGSDQQRQAVRRRRTRGPAAGQLLNLGGEQADQAGEVGRLIPGQAARHARLPQSITGALSKRKIRPASSTSSATGVSDLP